MILWNIYSYFYDTLNELIPYRNMIHEISNLLNTNKDSVILDAGCGTGNLCKALLKPNRSVIGIDRCTPMLKIARPKLNGQAEIKEMDINKQLEFPSNMFDGAALINVLYVVEEPERVLKEIYRVLKPSGTLVLVNPVPNINTNNAFYEHCKLSHFNMFKNLKLILKLSIVGAINFLISIKGKKKNYHFISQENLSKMLQNQGFEVVSSKITYADECYMFVARKQEIV